MPAVAGFERRDELVPITIAEFRPAQDLALCACSFETSLVAALREMARVCAPGGRILVVDAYAPEDPTQAAEYNRIERLRDPSHARALSLPELASLFSCCGLGQPWITSYELPVELKDLLARAFPNPGDEAEIAAVFTAAAVDGRLGIPVRREGEAIHIAYQAAILAVSPAH